MAWTRRVGGEAVRRLGRLRRSLGVRQEGQSLIEFALCLPLLLLIVTGILTFGLTFTQYLQLNEAVSTGSRLFAISRGSQGDPCAVAVTSIEAAAPSLQRSRMTFSFQVYTSATSSTTFTSSCSGVTLFQGVPVVVAATYPCSLSWYGSAAASGCVLKSQTTEIIQ